MTVHSLDEHEESKNKFDTFLKDQADRAWEVCRPDLFVYTPINYPAKIIADMLDENGNNSKVWEYWLHLLNNELDRECFFCDMIKLTKLALKKFKISQKTYIELSKKFEEAALNEEAATALKHQAEETDADADAECDCDHDETDQYVTVEINSSKIPLISVENPHPVNLDCFNDMDKLKEIIPAGKTLVLGGMWGYGDDGVDSRMFELNVLLDKDSTVGDCFFILMSGYHDLMNELELEGRECYVLEMVEMVDDKLHFYVGT